MNLKSAFTLGCGIFLLLMSVPLAAAPFAYVTNAGLAPSYSGTVSVIDIATNTVVGSAIPVGTQPYGIAVTPDGSHVYVANEGYGTDLGSVSVIATSSNTVTATIPHSAGITVPIGVAITPDGKSVYVTNFGSSTVSVIATATNTISATVTVGNGPGGIAVTPDGTKVYVANQFDGTVSVIATATNTVSAVITGLVSPAGVAITPDGGHVYVVNVGAYPSYAGTVSVIATATNTITSSISVGTEPLYAAVTPNGAAVYVTNFGSGTVSAIATATNTITATIPVASSNTIYYFPFGIDITADGTKVYVVETGDFAVGVIDTATNTVTGSPINVGYNPYDIAIQKPATPAQKVSNLITLVQGMNISGQGTSLTDQLQIVENDLAAQNGLACTDLGSFANHVAAQTGKKITTSEANQLQAAVASIEAALSCGH